MLTPSPSPVTTPNSYSIATPVATATIAPLVSTEPLVSSDQIVSSILASLPAAMSNQEQSELLNFLDSLEPFERIEIYNNLSSIMFLVNLHPQPLAAVPPLLYEWADAWQLDATVPLNRFMIYRGWLRYYGYLER